MSEHDPEGWDQETDIIQIPGHAMDTIQQALQDQDPPNGGDQQ